MDKWTVEFELTTKVNEVNVEAESAMMAIEKVIDKRFPLLLKKSWITKIEVRHESKEVV
jgi:hypothetical protein